MLKQATALAVIMTLAACSGTATSTEEASTSAAETAPAAEIGRTAGYNPDRNAYFGDLHIHTRSSFDAYIFNVRRTADDAYRFALGETIQHPSGFDMTIAGGPLDFYTVTNHAEYLGILPAMDTPGRPCDPGEVQRSLGTAWTSRRNQSSACGGVPRRQADLRENPPG